MKRSRHDINAFMRACPVCGSGLREHQPEDDSQNEWWHFFCGGQVVRTEEGRLEENEPCRDALRLKVSRFNSEKNTVEA